MAQANPDAEIQALQAVINALEPLDDDARSRVLEYTMRRLGAGCAAAIADAEADRRHPFAREDTVSLIEELTGSLARSSYDRGSLATHVASTDSDVRQLKMYVDGVLAELLQVQG